MRKICYEILLAFIIFLLFLPNFLSTQLGTQLLISFLGKKIQLTKLHLSWFGRQKILQLEIIKQNQHWFSSPEVTIDNSLISLLLLYKLKIEVREPKLFWEEKSQASSASLQSHTKPKNSFDLFNCIQALRITNGSFKIVPLDCPAMQFDHIDLKWTRQQGLGHLILLANSLQNQSKGSIHLQGSFLVSKKTHPLPLTLKATCTNLSTEFLHLFTQDFPVRSLLGDVFDLKLDVKEQLYTFDLSSPLVKTQGLAHWDKKKEQLTASSIPISFTLTQGDYAFIKSLMKLPALTLAEPSVFHGMIHQLSLNTKAKGFFPSLNQSSLVFHTELTSEKLLLASPLGVSHISSLQIQAKVSEERISSQIQAVISAKKQGWFSSDISWEKQIETLHAEIRASELPTYLIEGIFPQISLQRLWGPSIDLTLHAKLLARNGPLSVEVLSPYSSFSLQGQLQKEAITLDKPLYCQLSKEAGVYVLQEIFPSLQPKNPISIKIAAGETLSFSYPFLSMQWVIPSLEIEMGKVLCHKQNFTSSLFNLLKIHQFDATITCNLWIAPITMHIDKSLITVERVELLLADIYEIAIWGKIKDHSLKMKVGLPASTLTKAFQIPNLPDDYVLALTLEGSLENPQINLKKAAAKIAALFICQQNKNPLNILFPLCKSLQKTPIPPAKHPFPWEQRISFAKDKNSKRFKPDDKPLEQLLKVMR
ncbi:hypothetical protein RHABOEDO_000947 [Candidatus Rhabdochlamydia oedothoracis]|uniref:AsmA-like C-terminal domain-containing protein n=1 Tax=Candidatus Rhabdochlamydia oedothoracis TaxID=2720720 RepID=A0ABX8V0I8_9BACT|nr:MULTISPECIES: hypothetical protein [Rhabdochlamydia]KAG6559752.1 hypothetical protein RHOW815_000247 [Candidatus Rhabdochlamydia sp. W815]MCL6756707.1 hypothetical protein [Candidatus Rhabdochlamydia oedothoracis]QYF48735.1 hypothetical protein RHABOEDO_000947 [Candidatus Rhabdochlamydia oedothoracis]